MKPLLLLPVLMLSALTAAAQTPLQRQLEIAVGSTLLTRQDLVFSPFVHQGMSPLQVGLTYRRNHHWVQAWSLDFVQVGAQHQPPFAYTLPNEPDEVQQAAAHQFTLLDLGYHFGRPLASRGRHTWTLGGAVSADLDALTYNHARISNFGYFLAFDAAVWGQWVLQIAPRQRLSADVQVPLLAWTARSPYLINDDDFIQNIASHRTLRTLGAFVADGQLTTLNRYQRATLHLRYDWQVGRRWQIGIGLRGDWLHHQQPRALRVLQQQVTLRGVASF